MKILALETSAKSVSVAVTEDGVPLASSYQNTGLTHSRTLMPLLDAMLTSSGLELQNMDALAVAAGPGSFTGLRIGVSALKGLALFRARGGALERLTPDRAIGIEELAKELADISAETGKIVVGDGAQLCYTGLLERGVSCTLAPAALRMQNAVGVALCAEEMVRRGETTSARDLVPVYLRLSQAERERLAKGLKITVD